MKTKILVKKINPNVELPKVIKKGDWVDLRCAETTRFKAPQSGTLKSKTVDGKEEKYRNVSFDLKLIPLGVAIKLPQGYEAIVAPRSSAAKGMGVMQANSIGIIDNTYCSNKDEWKFAAVALRDTTIQEGERICQFRIQLSQKATFWQKLKYMLSSGIEIVEVDNLPEAEERKGFGEGTKNIS